MICKYKEQCLGVYANCDTCKHNQPKKDYYEPKTDFTERKDKALKEKF